MSSNTLGFIRDSDLGLILIMDVFLDFAFREIITKSGVILLEVE